MSKETKVITAVRNHLKSPEVTSHTFEHQRDFLIGIGLLSAGDRKMRRIITKRLNKVFTKLKATKEERQEAVDNVLKTLIAEAEEIKPEGV